MARLSLGLDVGHHHVRAVTLGPPRRADLRAGKRARLLATACVDRLGPDGSPKPLPAVLAEIETLLARTGPATAHFSDVGALARFIPTIPLPPDKRQRLLRLELLQHADEHGDLAADAWEVALAGDEIIHGCIVSQPAALLHSLAAVRAAGLPTPAISYAPAAIANAFEPDELPTGQYSLVIDIGATATGVTLLGAGHLLACRQVPVGGDGFTEALMASGLDRATAERRKRGGDLAPAAEKPTSVKPTVADLEFEADPEPATVFPTDLAVTAAESDSLFELADHIAIPAPHPVPSPAAPLEFMGFDEPSDDSAAPLMGTIPLVTDAPLSLPGIGTTAVVPAVLGPELQRNAEVFYSQLAASVLWFKTQLRLDKLVIGKVWLAGGSANLPGLDTYLGRRFNAPVAVFDPFAQLSSDSVPADAAAWTTAIGLALSDPGLGGRRAITLDVRPESLVRTEFRNRHLIWPYVAAGILVAATGVAAYVLEQAIGAHTASIEKYDAWKAKRTELMTKLTALEADKTALNDDLRAIAGRIYAGRDLLATVRALKEQTELSPELWVTRLETKGVSSDPLASDTLGATPAAKSYDSAIDRGAVLVSGKVKFNAAPTDTGLDQFLKSWRESIATWKLTPDSPTLFLRQRVVEWDPNHRAPGVKPTRGGIEEGEFPFKIEFTFRPTELSQITANRDQPEAGK